MSTLTDGERLVKLETQLDAVQKTLDKIDKQLTAVLPTFVTHDEHKATVDDLRSELSEIKGKRWIQNTLSSILGSVLTFLVSYALFTVFKR